jgi:hypothetical protein
MIGTCPDEIPVADLEICPESNDGYHCDHWYQGDSECCHCDTAALDGGDYE